MSEFDVWTLEFKEGEEIPKDCGYKHGNRQPQIQIGLQGKQPVGTKTLALIMDDPDAMAAVGKVWVHWLRYHRASDGIPETSGLNALAINGKNDFGEIGYGGPAPPDKRHTYVFKAYALDIWLDLKEGYSKQELEDAMKGHIIAEAKLTGTFAP
jgi:hypothetical protein